MRRWALPITAVATVVGVALAGWWLGIFRLHDYVEFTPPPAQVVSAPNCGLADITRSLAGPGDFGRDVQPGVGSVPSGFSTVAVIRCERSDNPSGGSTIHAVRMAGDVDAVADAFRIRSRRNPDGVSTSCAVGSTPPVAVWLVAADGSAVRPQWPSVICGNRDEPMVALKRMQEVDRTPVAVLDSLPPSSTCRSSTFSGFHPTTESGGGGSGYTGRQTFLLMNPTDDVDALTACRYRTSGENSALTGSRRVTATDSRRAVTAGVSAPPAPACDRTATEIITTGLSRPDGSGGGLLMVEVDGCRRFTIPYLTGYRSMPADALALLTGSGGS